MKGDTRSLDYSSYRDPLGRPLGYLIFSLMALIGDHIY